MPYSRQNDRFYKEWTAPSGTLYRITFQPGYHIDPAGAFNEVELPDNIILKDTLKIKGNYDKDIPIGMPKAITMDIEMDLRGFTGDFIDVGTWMLQKKGQTQKTVNGRLIDIPNRWFIQYESIAGGGLNTFKFDGMMDLKPESNLPLGNDNFTYKLKCLGMERAVLERVLMADLTTITPTLNADGSPINKIDFGEYIDGSDTVYPMWSPISTYQLNFNSFVSLTVEIETFADVMIQNLTRNPLSQTGSSGLPYDNITFYKRNSNIDGSRGSALSSAGLLFVSSVTDGSNNIGGQLVKSGGTDTSQNSWAESYNNAWDLMKYLTEGSRQKVLIGYRDTSNNPLHTYKYLYIFDEDTTRKSAAQRTLTKADLEFIDKDSGAKHSEKIVSQSMVKFDSVAPDDITQIELTAEGIISQNSFDSDLLLHNHPLSTEHLPTKAGNQIYMLPNGHLHGTDFTLVFPINRLYYQDGSDKVRIVHYTCDIDYGDSITQSNSTIDSWPIVWWPASLFKKLYNANVLSKTKFTGLGNLIAQSTLDLMANSDQYILTVTCKSNLVDINDLGNIFTIDIDEIKNDAILITYPKVTTTCVLVSVEEDVVNERSKCKFFIRGTNSI